MMYCKLGEKGCWKDGKCHYIHDCENKVLTNADRIRSMSDDELNDLFYEIYNAGAEDASSYEWGQRKNSFEWTMDWLQMPTETHKENNNATY